MSNKFDENAEGEAAKFWPEGIFPYKVTDQVTDPERIAQAIQLITKKAPCISFVNIDDMGSNHKYLNYAEFDIGDDLCLSNIGMQPGVTKVTITDDCSVGSVAHEIMHALGFLHEQVRTDRDDFVTLSEDNVASDRLEDWDTNVQTISGVKVGDYDYDSIMHYPKDAFGKSAFLGKETTIVTPDGEAIGQRTKISDGDQKALLEIYKQRTNMLDVYNETEQSVYFYINNEDDINIKPDVCLDAGKKATYTGSINDVLHIGFKNDKKEWLLEVITKIDASVRLSEPKTDEYKLAASDRVPS